MNFGKDIFISYAHIDDEPLVEGERGWVSEFHRSLEIRLSQLLGYKPVIWRDIDLEGNHVFSDEILQQFPTIAVMVSVISPRYVKSEWCIREVSEFIKASEKNIGLNVRNRSRIFKAIKTPVSLSQHPSQIQGMLGYEFFRFDPDGKRVNEFSHIFGPEAQRAYWARLNDIAHDICALLEEMKSAVPSDAGDTSAMKETAPVLRKGKIYLAETTRDLSESREAVKRELTEHGYDVLPDRNMPLDAEEYGSTAAELMEQCELLVHFLGKNYGIVPEGTDKSVVHLQAETGAVVCRARSIPRLVWLAPGSEGSDARQDAFVTQLRTSESLHVNADIIESSIEDLKFAIHDKLEERRKKEIKVSGAAPGAAVEEGTRRIYLICDKEDVETTGPLEDALFRQGIDVITPVFEGEQAQVREDHQENLKLCDGVIIYYGKGNELWLRAMMRDLLKAVGYGRTAPLDKKAVYIAGPSTPQKERFRSHEVTVINGMNGFDENALSAFTGKLRA